MNYPKMDGKSCTTHHHACECREAWFEDQQRERNDEIAKLHSRLAVAVKGLQDIARLDRNQGSEAIAFYADQIIKAIQRK